MARLLSFDLYDEIFELFENSQSQIRIVSPFIGLSTALDLSRLMKSRSVHLEMITRFSQSDFYERVSSLDGLEHLCLAGADILAVRNLHTKLYIFDDDRAILGSSNFTRGGLYSNQELNILLDDEPEIVDSAVDYFNEMKTSIPRENQVSLELIRKHQVALSKLPTKSKPKFDERWDFGFEFTPKKRSDFIESAFLGNGQQGTVDSTAWIKFEGYSDNRRTKGEEPIRVDLVNGLYKTSFPKRPVGFKSGDLVFVGRNSFDNAGNPSSLIFGYGTVKKWEKNQEEPAEKQRTDPEAKRWPYFVYIENFKYLQGKLNDCISVHDLYREVGKLAFPSTKTKEDATEKGLRRMHSQKDKLRITDEGKQYLSKEVSRRIRLSNI